MKSKCQQFPDDDNNNILMSVIKINGVISPPAKFLSSYLNQNNNIILSK